MKRLHRRDLWCWSEFNEDQDIDFNGFAWILDSGNILFDPPPMSAHDLEQLSRFGGCSLILITNSFHVRGAEDLAKRFGAKIIGPAAEKDDFPIACDRWMKDLDQLPDLLAFEMDGSKTPGELAFVLDGTDVIFGDLVRSPRADELTLLKTEQGLTDRSKAGDSIRRLLQFEKLRGILVGDGWCLFRDGHRRLADFAKTI